MNEANDYDYNPVQILTSQTHLDHVYSYYGQSYGNRESAILNELNKLSQRNYLLLQRSQTTSRDVRILLPTQIPISLEDNDKHFKSGGSNILLTTVDENEDDILINSSSMYYPKPETCFRQFENKNYQTFLFNFNKIAAACYLKVLTASAPLWNLYSINSQLESETNFHINKNPTLTKNPIEAKRIERCLNDHEFVANYVGLMMKMHNRLANKLYILLNTPNIKFHMSSKTNGKKKFHNSNESKSHAKKNSERHLFRSFRILGLRQPKNKFKKSSFRKYSDISSSFVKFERKPPSSIDHQFNDIIDIRSAFDIRQFQNKSGYDCFIECEMSYYKILDDESSNTACVNCQNELNFRNKMNLINNIQTTNLSSDFTGEKFNVDHLNYVDLNLLTKHNTAFKYTDNDLTQLSKLKYRLKD